MKPKENITMSETKIISPTIETKISEDIQETESDERKTTTTITNLCHNPMKGRNVSGRSWKHNSTQSQKASNLRTKVQGSVFSTSWEKKMQQKQRRKAMLERQNELKEEKRQAIIAKKERRLEQERRRMENEFKNASKGSKTLNANTSALKMKAMNKKQLRQIKKTRMNTKTGVVEYVSPYAK